MKLTQTSAVFLGAAIALVSVSSSAFAASFNWSYQGEFNLYTGTMEGIIQPDGNTVQISKVENIKLDGTLLPPTPFVFQASLFPASSTGIVSFDGTVMDLSACQDSACNQGLFFRLPPLDFEASSLYGNNTETFDAGFWKLQTIPEPTSVLGIIAGSAIAGLLTRKKKG